MNTPLQLALTIAQDGHKLTTHDLEDLFQEFQQEAFDAGYRRGQIDAYEINNLGPTCLEQVVKLAKSQ